MRKVIVLIGILAILSGCANISPQAKQSFSDWSKADYSRQVVASTLHIADWLQTREIATNPNYYERNPVLGRNPSLREVNTYFATTLIGSWIVADLLPPKWRKYYQYVGISSGILCVSNNAKLGIGFKF